MTMTMPDIEAPSTTDWTPLHQALQAIAAQCDGAVKNDGVGFRGQDVLFGHRIARYVTPEEYTDDLAREVYRLTRIYKVQLSHLGIDFDSLPKPEVEATETVHAARDMARAAERKAGGGIKIDLDGGDFKVTGKTFDHKDVIKQAGARWDSADKAWRIKVTDVGKVAWLVQVLHAEVSQAAEVLLEGHEDEAKVEPEKPQPLKAVAILPDRLTAVVAWKNVETADFETYVSEVRRLPGRRYLAAKKANIVDISEDLLAFMDRHGFEGRDAVVERLGELAEAKAQEALRAAAAEQASRAHTTERTVALSDHLYPFQRAGVAYVVDHAGGRAIIGDEMGLGKTRQGLAVLEDTESYPAVIVCPAHLKSNWLKETKALLPGRSVEVVSGLAPYRTSSDIVIINYDILGDWVDTEPDNEGDPEWLAPVGLVLDESHYVKNDKAQRTHAAKRLAARVPEAGVVTLLTGTPVLNRPAEIISQLEIIDSLDIFGRKVDFLREHCLTTDENGRTTYGGARNLTELNTTLRQNCYVRREMSDVLPELPSIARHDEVSDISPAARREYEDAVRNIVAYLRDLKGDEAAYKASRAEVLVRLNTLRQIIGKAKIENGIRWGVDFVESTGRKLIVFAVHVPVQEGLATGYEAAGLKVDRIKAGMSQDQIAKTVEGFQTGDTQILVCSLKAGGTGHTLTAASDTLFIEQGWTPGEHDQAEARTRRPGQEAHGLTAHYLLVPASVDDTLFNLIASKRAVVSAVTNGEEVDDDASIVDQVVDALLSGQATRR